MFRQIYMKKLEVAKVGQISTKVSDHSLLRNLQRCIKQQDESCMSQSR